MTHGPRLDTVPIPSSSGWPAPAPRAGAGFSFPLGFIPNRKQGDKMESSVVMDRPRARRGKGGPRQPNREHSQIDQRLGAAKNAGKTVRFTMTQEASFLDEDCEVDAIVVTLDKYDIEVNPIGWNDRDTVWLKKSAIMATRIFR